MAYVYITLDDSLAARGTEAFGINNLGQVVGDYIDASEHRQGFLLNKGTYTTVDDPTQTGNNQLFAGDIDPQGINDQDVIVGNGCCGDVHAPRVGAPNVDGINNLGHFVGYYADINVSGHSVKGFLPGIWPKPAA